MNPEFRVRRPRELVPDGWTLRADVLHAPGCHPIDDGQGWAYETDRVYLGENVQMVEALCLGCGVRSWWSGPDV